MISQGAVSLRAARQDCGLSPTGNMKPVEFKERTGQSNPSLASLRGTIACKSSKQPTGVYRVSANPKAACRPNWSEENVFNIGDDFYATLSDNVSVYNCYPYNNQQAMAGYSFVGTMPPGQFKCSYNFDNNGAGTCFLEIIGWTSGYHSGTPHYYVSVLRDSLNETITLNGVSGYPYLTFCIQAISFDGAVSAKLRVHSARIYR